MRHLSGFMISVLLVFLLIFFVVAGFLGLGFLKFSWPWSDVEVATTETTITYDKDEPEPKIVKIEAIGLECHSRVYANVPVRASREHQLIGQTYRTDTVEMVAIGDVDTCVEADQVRVEERSDGSFDVIVPAEAIQFSRPRVDAVATMNSVVYDKGLIGKITDIFPWVSDNSALTPSAYAFAQTVIGGSDCMQEAYKVTEKALRQAYENQVLAQGAGDISVDVIIDGSPDFEQNELADDPAFADFDFSVDGSVATCETSAGAIPVPIETAEDL